MFDRFCAVRAKAVYLRSAMAAFPSALLLIVIFFLRALFLSNGESFIGVNYGQVADNLPPPRDTAELLQTTAVQKVRLYGSDQAVIRSFANTGIGIFIGTSNADILPMAGDPTYARTWAAANVLPAYPATDILLISVGNEVLSSGDGALTAALLPAMQNLRSALEGAGRIRVTTVHAMDVLGASDPPSAARFDPARVDLLRGLLGFCNATGAPFAINPYPYFAYRSDPRSDTLSFCLFQPNPGRIDPGTRITYRNMFDAQVDAVRSALNSIGFPGVEIVVAETGWAYKGDSGEIGPSIENAKAYNGNLVAHLRSGAGTPLMPGKTVDTYLFALYDEDLKGGPGSERAFGLFNPDLTPIYDAGLSKPTNTSQAAGGPVARAAPGAATSSAAAGCVGKAGVTEAQLRTNLDYACGKGGVDCRPIQPGGACFEPDTVAAHAAYAMNRLYQNSGRRAQDCDFSGSAMVSPFNQSYGSCLYGGDE